MIEGLSHLTFVVKDLECTAVFFRSIFGGEEIYSSEERTFSLTREKFFSIAGQWIVLMEGEPLPNHTYNHVAFKISDEEFDLYEARVRELGVEVRPPRPRVEGEGRSLYFYDYDHHLFELHTGTLTGRLARYAQ